MIQTAFGGALLDRDLQAFLVSGRLEAAKALRVLRDSRRIDLAGELDFIVRAPGQEALVRFGHPSLWSVSLEPKVSVIDFEGRRLTGERDAVAPVEEYLDFFRRRPEVSVIARFSGSHLDAWARSGMDFPFIHTPLIRRSQRQGVKLYERGSAVAALGDALDANYAGVAHLRGGAVIAGDRDICSLAELILLIEQAAQVELLSETWTRSGALARRRDEEKAPSWA